MAKKRAVKASKKAVRRTLKTSARRVAKKGAKKHKAAKKRSKKSTKKGPKRAAPRGRLEDLLTGMTTIEIAEADGTTQAFVVVEMSNNGPHDIRAITVDQIHVVENVATTNARSQFDISAHFNPPVRIGWEIFAGMQFPRAGVFLVRPGQRAEVLGQQAPLKKGVPWLDEKPVN